MSRPRVVLLRGHNVNVWDLRPLERLTGEYDLSVLLTGSNVHRVEGLGLPIVPARTPRDSLPAGRAAGSAAHPPRGTSPWGRRRPTGASRRRSPGVRARLSGPAPPVPGARRSRRPPSLGGGV